MIHRVTYQGQPALIGLTWRQAGRRAVKQPLVVEWGGRVAFVDDDLLAGFASALSIAAQQIPPEDRLATILTLIRDDNHQYYAYHVLVDGVCTQEKEAVFVDHQAFITAVHAVLADGQIDGIAADAVLLDQIETPLKKLALTAPAKDTDFAIANTPANKAASPLVLMGGIAAIALGVVAWYTLAPMIADWSRSRAQSVQPQQTQTITYSLRDKSSFTSSCIQAFVDNWPQAPGWQLQAEGCADIGMSDPELTGYSLKTPVAYRKFNLQSGYNPILARRVAEAVYDSADYDVTIAGNNLFATRPISAPRHSIPSDLDKMPARDFERLIEDLFVAKTHQISGQGRGAMVVRTTEDFATAINVPNRSDKLGFVYVHRKGGITHMGLTQRPVFRQVGG